MPYQVVASHDRLPSNGVGIYLRYLFKFWLINDNISETVQCRDVVTIIED